ncbi:MAG: hypothetical protein J5552_06155 [Prevotella sp.]|nr:hypothetical protein [Prevotella sp.]
MKLTYQPPTTRLVKTYAWPLLETNSILYSTNPNEIVEESSDILSRRNNSLWDEDD